MRRYAYKASILILVVFIGTQLFAQNNRQNPRNRPTTGQAADDYFGTSTRNNSRTTTQQDTTIRGQQPRTTTTQQQPQQQPAGGNLPVEFIPSSGNPLTDSMGISLRREDAVERNSIKDRFPLPYEIIREDDAVFREKIWRIIDTREKMNLYFRNPSIEDGKSQLFLAILYKAVTEDSVVAFRDEHFSKPYTIEDFKMKFSGGMDTVDVYDLDGNVVGRQARAREFMVDSVVEYQIKEEWIFDKESSRMVVRIIGIAPMMKTYLSSGEAVSQVASPLFWLYYPDLRTIFAKCEVYNGKNYGARMTWEELFETRYFSSRIVKSTMDNPLDQPLRGYIKDPLFQLLEGEKIKQKIFDYEQNLWEY